MTGQKAGAPLTEAMFYVLMALRRGELCGTEDRRMGGAGVRRGGSVWGRGHCIPSWGVFLEGGASFRRRRCEKGTAAELSVDGEGSGRTGMKRLRLRLCLADAERENAGEAL